MPIAYSGSMFTSNILKALNSKNSEIYLLYSVDSH